MLFDNTGISDWIYFDGSLEIKAENISFCTVLSDCECYDLIEQKAKRIEYTTYLNYHDETYADWWLVDRAAKSEDG